MKRLIWLLVFPAILFLSGCDETTGVEEFSGIITIINNSGLIIEGFIDNDYYQLNINETGSFTVDLEDEDNVEQVEITYRIQNSGDYITTNTNISEGDEFTIVLDKEESTLKIQNYSQEQIWYRIDYGTTLWLNSLNEISHNFDLLMSNYGNETRTLEIEYGGDYWWFYDYQETISMSSNEVITLEIISDAGEIEIMNNSFIYYIFEVYLAPSSDPTWGSDDLGSDTIAPGESIVWKVTVGDWDVKVVDNYGDEFTSFNNYIAPEERTIFYYGGLNRSDDPDGEKLKNSQSVERVTKDLVEKR